MKLSLLAVAALFLASCADNHGPVADTEGPNAPLANPAANSLNSPTTAPSTAGVPGGPIGSGSNAPGTIPTAVGRR